MPRRFERHKRTKWEWGLPGARSGEVREAARADPEPAKRAPARKDTKHWCHGKEGAEHVPHLVLAEDTPQAREHACRWTVRWDWQVTHAWAVGWKCGHREACAGCGRVLRELGDLKARECPVYPGSETQHAEAEAELVEMQQMKPRVRWRRKPVITGKQGYRRRRDSA